MGRMKDEIHTERLTLRRPAPADQDAMIEIHTDPATSRYIPTGPENPAEAERQFESWLTHWTEHGFGYWAITLTDSGKTIGFGGLRHNEFDGEHYLNLAYRIRPSAWGNGYAPEMAAAAVEWAVREMPDLEVRVVTDVDNTPAVRVAERAGFVEYKQGPYRDGQPCRFMRLPTA
ncbi:RimJ/RimL family protein N-acetyltransferase [Herbihabitans rhizosphaerae]|uniref:RimJ/RimL family protein N-acetyltransferase n=1 Tax=Herbihabitans rhizosphaerae TaxID=1872711 RepID=A0A4Q7KFZ8_9PSEU|nr:GNAT family N-acetyltransferase [Herbihabitans rhizosphaerae]RZS32476.1 RimJ/RimL family protein N-acetyltransferase [Herbihabitans rhizosphaerae]